MSASPDREADDAPTAKRDENLTAFGSSEFAKVVLGAIWGTPPPLDLDAEADLHTLLGELARRKLIHSARDISDGGIAVALAQAAFATASAQPSNRTIAPGPSALRPLRRAGFHRARHGRSQAMLPHIEELADEYNFIFARIGTTGGNRLEISVDGDTFISAPLDELRTPWAAALESALHDEVTA